jgi:hypothetical protein
LDVPAGRIAFFFFLAADKSAGSAAIEPLAAVTDGQPAACAAGTTGPSARVAIAAVVTRRCFIMRFLR